MEEETNWLGVLFFLSFGLVLGGCLCLGLFKTLPGSIFLTQSQNDAILDGIK